jgi:hypothetical protein
MFALAHNRPPCASMIERQIDSPNPKPLGLFRVVPVGKSNPHIQMMKSAEKWRRQNATNGMYCSRRRRVLVD